MAGTPTPMRLPHHQLRLSLYQEAESSREKGDMTDPQAVAIVAAILYSTTDRLHSDPSRDAQAKQGAVQTAKELLAIANTLS
jgi:hypothetical protein